MVYGTRNRGKRKDKEPSGVEEAVNQVTQHPPAGQGPKVSDVAPNPMIDTTKTVYE